VRLCCSLCLLENAPSVIEPDVLSKDRDEFEASGDERYVDKAHRRGKIGGNVGRHIEVALMLDQNQLVPKCRITRKKFDAYQGIAVRLLARMSAGARVFLGGGRR
jgi:hypothetical protein